MKKRIDTFWRYRKSDAFYHDTDHVSEQASVQQELWYGRSTFRGTVYHYKSFESACI